MKNKKKVSKYIASVVAVAMVAVASPIALADKAGSQHGHKKIKRLVKQVKTNTADIATNAMDIADNSADIIDLDTRVSKLEKDTTAFDVNCSTDTITNTLASAPIAGPVTLNIIGDCTETLVIDRDNVSLVGDLGASITYAAPITDNEYRSSISSTVTIIGADNVLIKGLTIRGAADNATSSGLRLISNASALVKDTTIENNNNGVWASNTSAIQFSNSVIQNNNLYGLLVTDNSNAEVRENNTISHAATKDATIGIYRNGTVRVRDGGNTITNSFANGDAIEAFHGSQFRNDNGSLVVNGNGQAGLLSQIEFRDATVNGNLQASVEGVIRLRSKNTVTVNGDVSVSGLGLLQIFDNTNSTTIDGNVICTGYNAAAFGTASATITGSPDLNGTCNL